MIEVKRGDVFGSLLPETLSEITRIGESVLSQDGEAGYSHTGIITNEEGDTFEAQWTVRRQNLFTDYKGAKIIVARWSGMTDENFQRGMSSVEDQEGCLYPGYRILLMMLGWSRIRIPGQMVCSEITSNYLINAGAPVMEGKNPYGVTPDYLVDEWRKLKQFDIVFEGIL